jgi:hypothetical protein
MAKPLRSSLALAAAMLCAACEPTFELADRSGTRVELTLPPATLKAFRDIDGTPSVKVEPGPGRPAVVVGACGSLTLTGQGYHGSGKRAARGRMSLDCGGPLPVTGDLSFTGCF